MKTNVEELTLREIREIAAAAANIGTLQPKPDDSHWQVGKNYFIRTVTHHLTGKLEKVTPQELVLSGAAWIADDGNFTKAMSENEFSEVEMFAGDREVIVGRGSLIDAQRVEKIPTSRK